MFAYERPSFVKPGQNTFSFQAWKTLLGKESNYLMAIPLISPLTGIIGPLLAPYLLTIL